MRQHDIREDRIIELETEVRRLKELLVDYGRLASNTPPNTAMLLGAALSGGDALALAEKLERPGTHCNMCGKPMGGKPRPGALVTHEECAMEAKPIEADRSRSKPIDGGKDGKHDIR